VAKKRQSARLLESKGWTLGVKDYGSTPEDGRMVGFFATCESPKAHELYVWRQYVAVNIGRDDRGDYVTARMDNMETEQDAYNAFLDRVAEEYGLRKPDGGN